MGRIGRYKVFQYTSIRHPAGRIHSSLVQLKPYASETVQAANFVVQNDWICLGLCFHGLNSARMDVPDDVENQKRHARFRPAV